MKVVHGHWKLLAMSSLCAAGVVLSSVVIDRCVWIAMLLWQQVRRACVYFWHGFIYACAQTSSPRENLVAGTCLSQEQCQYLKKSSLKMTDNGMQGFIQEFLVGRRKGGMQEIVWNATPTL